MKTANILSIEDFDAIPDPTLKLQAWAEMQALLAYLTAVERHARVATFDLYYPGAREDVTNGGLKNYPLGGGYTLKGTPSINYKLDKEQVDPTLSKIEKLGAEGKAIAERLVTFDPRLSKTEYDRLDKTASKQQAKAKELIEGILTITPGLPKLELEIPKTATAA